jgi:hypothetical protein
LYFFHFLGHKIAKSSTWTQYLIRKISRLAAKKKKNLGGSNTPLITASPTPRNLLYISPTVHVHQRQLLPASSVFAIHYTIPTLYSNRVLLFSQGARFLRCYGCFLSSGALMY